MNKYKFTAVFLVLLTLGVAFAEKGNNNNKVAEVKTHKVYQVTKTDAQWKQILKPEAYYILREKGTERAFSGKYNNIHEKGEFYCAACSNLLFDSKQKFDSGTGWPSFWQPAAAKNVEENKDSTFGMERTEVNCAKCGGHLGHVFDDGPEPTGLRYCINSDALTFKKN